MQQDNFIMDNSKEIESKLLNIVSDDEQRIDGQLKTNPLEENIEPTSSTGNLIEDLYNKKIKEHAIANDINFIGKSKQEDVVENIQENIVENKQDDLTENKTEFETNYVEENKPEQEKNDAIDVDNKLVMEESDHIENEENIENSENESSFEEMYKKTFGISPINSSNKVEEQARNYNQSNVSAQDARQVTSLKNKMMFNSIRYKFVGFAFSSYIIIEMDDELYIIDQKSANERIIYEEIKKNYYNNKDKESQLMLLPDIINLSSKQMAIAKDNFYLFKNAGFDLEEFGENTIKLNGVPNICMDLDTKELFIDCLNKINTIARTAKQEIEEKFLQTIASKIAENTRKISTFEEVDSLMQKLLVLDRPFESANEKGIAIRLSKYDIDKKF